MSGRRKRYGKGRNDGNNKFNETKYLVLKTLFDAKKHLSPKEVAEATGLSTNAAEVKLSELHKWGYLWRRREVRSGRRNYYCYRFPKPKGNRVFFELEKRVKIRDITGIPVSLNLDDTIPDDAVQEYERLGYVL